MNKSDMANFVRLVFCYQSDLPHLIPLEIVSDLFFFFFSAVTLTARANNRGDPVHSCHISFSAIWIILVLAHFCLWRDKVKDRFKTANTSLQIHIWQYCKWVNIANIYRLLSLLQTTDLKLSARYLLFVNGTSCCLILCELYQFTTNPSITGFIGDSAQFNNRFYDFPP